MKTTTQLLVLAWVVLFIASAHAQMTLGARRGDYTFGINGGFAYQSSDIRNAGDGSGFGLTLGRTLLAGPNAPLSVEARGRLLYARTFGLDPFRSFSIDKNKALNGDRDLNYLTYPANLDVPQGFVFQNHRTTHGELGLEAVFTLEELRRKTGFMVSVFGGLGLNGYQVKIDQANADGREYYEAYARLNANRPVSAVLRDLKGDILDGTYESNADGFDNFPKFRFMPSVGAELGIHISRSLILQAGHRITFSGTDLLDGQQWASQDRDIYHYTHFGLTYRFRPPARPEVLPPLVEIVTPLTRPHYTRDPNGVVLANVRNVQNPSELTCTVNGRSVPFRLSGDRLAMDFPLQIGSNNVVITARNRAGMASADALIILEQIAPPPPPIGNGPRINITNPPGRSATVAEPNFALRATITEVNSRNDIDLTIDGARRTDFSFDTRSGVLTANLNLREGVNRVRITARNSFGADAADADIVYEPRRLQPSVRILEPANRSETANSPANLRAEIRYVEAKEQIFLYVNGRESRDFSFDPARETLTASIPLLEGNNTIEVQARNRSGEARDNVSVTYRLPVRNLPPTVQFTTPATTNTSTSAATANIDAITRNVMRREDVSFFVNGAAYNNFAFNPGNGRISATINLVPGNNEVAIRVANADGSDQAAVTIRRTEQPDLPEAPRVRITSPANQATLERNTADVRAVIDNVSDRNNMRLLVNGVRQNNFTFTPRTRELSATVTLTEGNNTIRVEAGTPNGNAADEVNVRYRRAAAPPVVTISFPANNSTTASANMTLRARALNVSKAEQISVTLNGSSVSIFGFNPDTYEITAELTLAEGNNTVRVRATTPDGSDEKSANVVYRRATTPPVVTITAPANNSTTASANANLRARVQHVSKAEQISVTLNGNDVGIFGFNPTTGEVIAELTLVEGNNTVRVRATNQDGSDEKSVNIAYRRATPPVVTITTPENNGSTTRPDIALRARVQHVTNKNQVTVSLNGSNVSQFNFDLTTGELSADLTLVEGNNTLRVRAVNNDGNDEKSVGIRYRKPAPPVVTIQSPENNTELESNVVQVKAVIQNVNSNRGVTFTVNGRNVSLFNNENGQFTASAENLRLGENTITVAAQNADGADQATVTVMYKPKGPDPKPIVKFITPARGGLQVRAAETQIKASVQYVKSAEDIQIDRNGKPLGEFNYDAKTQELTATVPIEYGANAIRIVATNRTGSDTATTMIFRPEAISRTNPPSVNIVSVSQPTLNPMNPSQSTTTVIAQIRGVETASQITFLVNGEPITDFTFEARTGAFQSTVRINRGSNTIVLRAENLDGKDEKSRTIEF